VRESGKGKDEARERNEKERKQAKRRNAKEIKRIGGWLERRKEGERRVGKDKGEKINGTKGG
jgi:hypothetical protein